MHFHSTPKLGKVTKLFLVTEFSTFSDGERKKKTKTNFLAINENMKDGYWGKSAWVASMKT